MADVLREYLDSVWEKWNREAAWPPGADLEPGMVGSIDSDAFVFEGFLDDERYGITYEVLPDSRKTDEELQSRRGVSVKTKVAGEADHAFPGVPKAKAAFRADFEHEGAFVFRASGMRYLRLKNQEQVWQDVAAAMSEGRMSSDLVVVSEAAVCDRGTVIIASDRRASVVLSGEAEAGKSLDFGAKLGVEAYDRLYERVAGAEGMTVLYLLLRPRAVRHFDAAVEAIPELETVRVNEARVPRGLRRYTP